MRLLITDNPREEVSFDIIQMSTIEFNNIHNHPFIASTKFDEVVVDLNNKIRLGYLAPLMKTTKVIPRITTELDSYGVSILCEIYRERSAELRYAFMKDKDEFNRIINDMKTQYEWERFY